MHMQDNIRLIFSALWFPATGFAFAALVVFVLTLGDYWKFLLGAGAAWILITTIIWAVSLNA